MTPDFPLHCKYQVTQTYFEDANHYAEGHHGGLDLVPLNEQGFAFPADIYPVFSGKTKSVSNTDPRRGKGIKVTSEHTDLHFINYLKSNNVVPQDYNGKVFLDILDWHCLEVTDLDGVIEQGTPIAKCGNTGWVFQGGKEVEDKWKGVPPYPGLHDHHEHILYGTSGVFNLDKDPRGRINPLIILNYRKEIMEILQVVGESTLVVKNLDGKYYQIATAPELYPFVAKTLGLDGKTFGTISRAEVDLNLGGDLTAGLSFISK